MFEFIIGKIFGQLDAGTNFLIGMEEILVSAVIACLVVFRMNVFDSNFLKTK